MCIYSIILKSYLTQQWSYQGSNCCKPLHWWTSHESACALKFDWKKKIERNIPVQCSFRIPDFQKSGNFLSLIYTGPDNSGFLNSRNFPNSDLFAGPTCSEFRSYTVILHLLSNEETILNTILLVYHCKLDLDLTGDINKCFT